MITRLLKKSLLYFFIGVLFIVEIWHHTPQSPTYIKVYQQIPFLATKQDSLLATAEARVPVDVSTPTSTPSPIARDEDQKMARGGFQPEKQDQETTKKGKTMVEASYQLPWDAIHKGGSKPDHDNTQPQDSKAYMEGMLDWSRPSRQGHWPPYEDYVDRKYDPNRWEEFDHDYRFYTAGHHRLDPKTAARPMAYTPFPNYNSEEWKKEWEGEFVACEGPRGVSLNVSEDDQMRVYRGLPTSFPKVFAGGYNVVGLDGNVCFDRYSRYGPVLRLDGENPESTLHWEAPKIIPEWKDVSWGRLQDDCLRRNKARYHLGARLPTVKSRDTRMPDDTVINAAFMEGADVMKEMKGNNDEKRKRFHSRTAVLIRSWTGYTFEENDIMAIRAMILDVSLHSGGEYEVFLLVHVKDSALDIFRNTTLYKEVLDQNVPQELRSIAILWSEAMFSSWYSDIGDWQVYWQQFMCLQWFSLMHPQFDYVWNWETDARYTGHHYHFLETIGNFSACQPRKLLWERNKRFYIPSVHHSYAQFIRDTHAAILNASAHSLIPPPVWGPRPWKDAIPPQTPLGPPPPTSFGSDAFQWGQGEPADLITLLPIWDPRNTTWSYKDKIWNYIPRTRPLFTPEDPVAQTFTHPAFTHLDRRVFINTVARFSRKLLLAMHIENRAGRSMQAEMWPATVALQHGLKAVYAPHPIFTDRHWPARYAAAIFDAAATVDPVTGGAVDSVQGAWTERGDSPYNHDRESNFKGWSWYFASDFPRRLYRRWLGWEVVSGDWEEEERVEGGRGAEGEKGGRRMCLPGMLLHPVKRMDGERVKA